MEFLWDELKEQGPHFLGIATYAVILFPSIILNISILIAMVLVIIIMPILLPIIIIFPTLTGTRMSNHQGNNILYTLGYWIGVITSKIHKRLLEDLPIILIKRSTIINASKQINTSYITFLGAIIKGSSEGLLRGIKSSSSSTKNSNGKTLKWWQKLLAYPFVVLIGFMILLVLFIPWTLTLIPLWILLIWINLLL